MRATDRDAEFVEFVAEHRPVLMQAARLLTAGDHAQAEDLVQTTLTKLYVQWPKVRRSDNPVGYARRSLTHVFIDEGRRAFRSRERVVAEPPAPDARREEQVADDHELRASVLDALGGLPPRQRAAVVLRHWFDLDVDQTARILNCSTGTVKSQTAKALRHLRASLEPAVTLKEIP
ncbi:SigE family RNA polymerase sigma factor [Nocardioides speluncae]|uniref:SigE family RNA polymerase sigma factor n=1 Tax=Nocardioides speluncae TaxID=2670337 RepID=UPI000D6935D3|nr:SigE family RNA polymerase sigma factor [Nocardioides speluncae]